MELYTLDRFYRPYNLIDDFISMIWTERFHGFGDFEIVMQDTLSARLRLATASRIGLSDSYRIMHVEFIERHTDDNGRKLLTVKGRSLETILDERMARNTFADLNNTPKWIIEGTPLSVATTVFEETCWFNTNFDEDNIPGLTVGEVGLSSNIPPSTVSIQAEIGLKTVYSVLSDIAVGYDFGFKFERVHVGFPGLYFNFYTGSDRTSLQNVVEPVIFSDALDSLSNIRELTSSAPYKNVAYVFHAIAVQIVVADGVNSTVNGFDRRVLVVDATNIEVPKRPYDVTKAQEEAINVARKLDTIPEELKKAFDKITGKTRLTESENQAIVDFLTVLPLPLTSTQRTLIETARTTSRGYDTTESNFMNARLQQRGREELAKNRNLQALDGEIPHINPYKYNVDYTLGDLVEMRNSDGLVNTMRVTEQIFVSDDTGERAYPTLVLEELITPGSWYASTEDWLTATGKWSER